MELAMAFKTLGEDLKAAMARDPAARSPLEVAFLYPGFHVLLFHRAAHGLWRIGLRARIDSWRAGSPA